MDTLSHPQTLRGFCLTESSLLRRVKKTGKSCAQVATLVAPSSGELKLKARLHQPKSSERVHPHGVRFSATELILVRRKAQEAGCSFNSYVRAATLGADFKLPRDPAFVAVLRLTLRELTSQGNNLNQLAHYLNAGLSTCAETETLLAVIYPPYLRTLAKVRTALAQDRPEP